MSNDKNEIPDSIRKIFEQPPGQFKANPGELYEMNFPEKKPKQAPPGFTRLGITGFVPEDGSCMEFNFAEPVTKISFDKDDALRFTIMVNTMFRKLR